MTESEKLIKKAEESIERINNGILNIDAIAKANNNIITHLKKRVNQLILRQKIILGYNILTTILLVYIILKLILNL